MIYIKQPEKMLPELKQRKGKRKTDENIMQYLAESNSQNQESEEERNNVFQNNKGTYKNRLEILFG